MSYKKKVVIDTIRTVAFGAITGAFGAVGAALAAPARIFILNNTTGQTLEMTTDGTNVQFILPPRSFKLIDITANKANDTGFFIAEGTVFYVRHTGAAPAAGAVYVEIIRS